jgi:hypothetical protein
MRTPTGGTFSGILSWKEKGPTLIGSTLRRRKYSRIASFASTSTTQLPSV